MKHLITILEIKHLSRDGRIIWQDRNLVNTLHAEGELFILDVLFSGQPLPENYYFGLDHRTAITTKDTITSLTGEPNNGYNGYARQPVSSVGQFESGVTIYGDNMVESPIMYFSAHDGSWGPVKNLFLTNVSQDDDSGYLISSVPLSSAATVNDGESLTLRMGLALRNILMPAST